MLNLLYGLALTSTHDYWKDHSLDYTDLCRQSDVSAFLIRCLSLSQLSFQEASVPTQQQSESFCGPRTPWDVSPSRPQPPHHLGSSGMNSGLKDSKHSALHCSVTQTITSSGPLAPTRASLNVLLSMSSHPKCTEPIQTMRW